MIRPVALLAPSFQGGGAERMMVHLARGLAQYGIRADLVLERTEGPYLRQVPRSAKVIDLREADGATSAERLCNYIRRRLPLAMLSGLAITSDTAITARRSSQVPMRLVVREATAARTKRLQQIRDRYHEADAVVATSQGVAAVLAQTVSLPPEKVHVIYNPTIPPDLRERAREAVDHPWFGPGQSPVILGVGSLRPAKNFAALIGALSLVRQKRPAKLVILGEGNQRARLTALAMQLGLREHVDLPGFVDNPYAFMARSAVLALPSFWEGCPNVLVEAMACGTPVVASAGEGGAAEVLAHGKYGHLVPVGDEQALADAIIGILERRRKRNAVDAAWLAQFTIAHATLRYMEVLGLEPRGSNAVHQ